MIDHNERKLQTEVRILIIALFCSTGCASLTLADFYDMSEENSIGPPPAAARREPAVAQQDWASGDRNTNCSCPLRSMLSQVLS
jgi:hypothetical protein